MRRWRDADEDDGKGSVRMSETGIKWGLLTIFAGVVMAACGDSEVEGSGVVVTETRTVAQFDSVRVNNGAKVGLEVDPTATGEVVLEVTTDSNLLEYLTTTVSGNRLSVSIERRGGATSRSGFEVSATVGALRAVSADNGAQATIRSSVMDLTLSADNGAQILAEEVGASLVAVDVDNGAQITVCTTGVVSGAVTNGAGLRVLCGGDSSGVETADGGTVSSS